MTYTQDLLDELHVLNMFNLESMQEGIKVHSSAAKVVVAAAVRLYDKGMITQKDGGFLTNRGLVAAQHCQTLCGLLTIK
jgi:uncharacterized protein (TIGR02647 family)